jgi:hypothetical protein
MYEQTSVLFTSIIYGIFWEKIITWHQYVLGQTSKLSLQYNYCIIFLMNNSANELAAHLIQHHSSIYLFIIIDQDFYNIFS